MSRDAGQTSEQPDSELVVRELNHRLKNTLTLVQAIARQSFRGAAIPEEAWAAFEGRLAALAVAHDAVSGDSPNTIPISEIVAKATGALDPGSGRLTAHGPTALISPRAAVALSLALHELATNAVKYGALGGQSGRVAIRWDVVGERLRLRWLETDGPRVIPPVRRGFGSRLLEQGLAGDLGGYARLDFQPGGLVCEIEAQLEG